MPCSERAFEHPLRLVGGDTRAYWLLLSHHLPEVSIANVAEGGKPFDALLGFHHERVRVSA